MSLIVDSKGSCAPRSHTAKGKVYFFGVYFQLRGRQIDFEINTSV